MKKTVIIILIILFIYTALSFFRDGSGTHTSYFTTGPIQVIGNKNELWMFLEFPRIVHHPRSSCSWDVPSVYPEGHFQEVLVFDRKGLKNRTRVSVDNGVSFHPNLSDIYIDHNRIYLHKGPSMNYKRSIFKWRDNHFQLLPFAVSEQYFERMGMKENNKESFRKAFTAFDELTVRSGWENIFESTYAVDSAFEWGDYEIRIDEAESNEVKFELAIEFSSSYKTDEPMLLTYYRDYEEYEGRKKREMQHAHLK